METQKFDFFQKSSKFEFDLCWRAEIIQVGRNMSTSGMHRRPFEGTHLVCYRVTQVLWVAQDSAVRRRGPVSYFLVAGECSGCEQPYLSATNWVLVAGKD